MVWLQRRRTPLKLKLATVWRDIKDGTAVPFMAWRTVERSAGALCGQIVLAFNPASAFAGEMRQSRDYGNEIGNAWRVLESRCWRGIHSQYCSEHVKIDHSNGNTFGLGHGKYR